MTSENPPPCAADNTDTPLEKFRAALRAAVGEQAWDLWFGSFLFVGVHSFEKGAPTVWRFNVETAVERDVLNQRFLSIIEDCWNAKSKSGIPDKILIRIGPLIEEDRRQKP